jgi:hypothetical protein
MSDIRTILENLAPMLAKPCAMLRGREAVGFKSDGGIPHVALSTSNIASPDGNVLLSIKYTPNLKDQV